MEPQVLLGILIFVGSASLVLGVAMFYRQYAGSKTLDERLEKIAGGTKTPTLAAAGILREQLYPENARTLVERLLPKLPSLEELFQQADFKMTPANFWTLTGAVGVTGALLSVLLRMPIWLVPIFAAMFGIVPLFYVLFLKKRRMAKLASQLCEGLELIARALRAGHALAAGMHVVAEEMPNPIAKEFRRVWDEQNLGVSIEEAMRNLAERVPNMDLKFFVTAVIVQRSTGGDLAEILDKIGHVIRERFKIMGMVQALTGEGRISGVVLMALPFGLLLLMLSIAPNYVALLWTDQRGQYMSGMGIVSMILGALWIRKVVNIKI